MCALDISVDMFSLDTYNCLDTFYFLAEARPSAVVLYIEHSISVSCCRSLSADRKRKRREKVGLLFGCMYLLSRSVFFFSRLTERKT